eukprot:4552082-Prymnesium_polylepis.1
MTAISGSMNSVLVNDKFVGWDFTAASCIDGIWGAGAASASDWSTCHSDGAQDNQWLSIVLSGVASVSSVIIYNRGDCCQENLGTYQVWVGDASGNPTTLSGMT